MKPAGINSLSHAPDPVFRVWRARKKIEIEAAAIFKKLADDLARLHGENDEVVQLTREAEQDEYRHADLCQEILNPRNISDGRLSNEIQCELGPIGLKVEQRVVYTCVAVSCITETLSTALLVEMQKRAEPGIIKNTVKEILKDEVNHSRIGWAELARVSRTRNQNWVAEFIPEMIEEALAVEVTPMLSSEEGKEDFSPWGILPPSEAQGLMRSTINEVVLPGLTQNGIDTRPIKSKINYLM